MQRSIRMTFRGALRWILWTATLHELLSEGNESMCLCTQKEPAKNRIPLLFCNWYRQKSCCLPAFDDDFQGKFSSLISAGAACSKYSNKAKHYLAILFCVGCHPEQPRFLGPPVDTHFYNATSTLKICASIADRMAPFQFDDCGLVLSTDRDNICASNSPIVANITFPDCEDSEYVCQDTAKNWYCSTTHCLRDTPMGFADRPCDRKQKTCDGVLKMMNDNRAAKPPNFEEYPVEIIDKEACMQQYHDIAKCSCLLDASNALKRWKFSIWHWVTFCIIRAFVDI
uniref:Uncharacterized protein AlNc14C19G1998 n=1 Tax=Albugo laibachii Nc14 TaxID=890382 RepID=F0W527_9STRA|nr:conserved hypothetical protein [Albugo laibachii Nc14]|eukprot:CCA16218.1 conserved hypothetical protein [Albugo laibachii Nc14]